MFDSVDGALSAWLSPYPRVLLWGVLAGIAAMLVYAGLSNQAALRAHKARMKDVQRRLKTEELEPAEAVRVALTNLGLACTYFVKLLPGALASMIPVLVVMAWLDNSYSYVPPTRGEVVTVRVVPDDAVVTVDSAAASAAPRPGEVSVTCCPGHELVFREGGSAIFSGLPVAPPVPVVHRRRWWNALLENPGGYLHGGARVEELHFDFDRRLLIEGWPRWVSLWEFPFFAGIFAAAGVLKVALRLE